MKDLQKLTDAIKAEIPDVRVELDLSSSPDGPAFVEFYRGPFKVFAEWRRGTGFGLSAGTEFVFGEGPHEVYRNSLRALERIKELLSTQRPTQAPDEVALDTLRVVRRMSQQQIARRLHITQASVSKIERQSDMYLSTLGKVVSAMGGQLELRAKFPDSEFKILRLGDLDERALPPAKVDVSPRLARNRKVPRVLRHK